VADELNDDELESVEDLVETLSRTDIALTMLLDSGPEHDQELFGFTEGELIAVAFVRERVHDWYVAALEDLHERRARTGR
jgi:hypothetical protein